MSKGQVLSQIPRNIETREKVVARITGRRINVNREGPGRATLRRSSPTQTQTQTQNTNTTHALTLTHHTHANCHAGEAVANKSMSSQRTAPNHQHPSFLGQTANKQGQEHYTINGGPGVPAIQSNSPTTGYGLSLHPSSPLMLSKRWLYSASHSLTAAATIQSTKQPSWRYGLATRFTPIVSRW